MYFIFGRYRAHRRPSLRVRLREAPLLRNLVHLLLPQLPLCSDLDLSHGALSLSVLGVNPGEPFMQVICIHMVYCWLTLQNKAMRPK